MLTILFIIFLIAIIIGYKLIDCSIKNYRDNNEILEFFASVTIVLSIISEIIIVLGIIACAVGISRVKVSDELIKVYEMENNNIQKQVSEIVENYKTHEKINIKDTDILVLAQLYPDLKSNDLVKTQIKIYNENNKKIKQIKEEKINYEICKRWLYFGK